MVGTTVERALAAVSAARIAERLEALASIGPDPGGGITRLGLTAEEQRARDLVRSWLAPLGYACGQDDAANLHCVAGDEPRVLVGSHLDTVPRGGAYDGALGVVAAAEVAEALHQAGIALPLHVVAWTGEEGVRFGTGLFGSAAACGLLAAADWERTDAAGGTARQAAEELLGRAIRPESIPMRPSSLRACLELHIEQSSLLERAGSQLGVVSTIVGLYHGKVTVAGQADHAGATAMAERQDALAAAAECVLAVEEVSAAAAGQAIATVGEIEVAPGAKNVVPAPAPSPWTCARRPTSGARMPWRPSWAPSSGSAGGGGSAGAPRRLGRPPRCSWTSGSRTLWRRRANASGWRRRACRAWPATTRRTWPASACRPGCCSFAPPAAATTRASTPTPTTPRRAQGPCCWSAPRCSPPQPASGGRRRWEGCASAGSPRPPG